MVKVYCRTNLDLFCEQWPAFLPAVPRVGDMIESQTRHQQVLPQGFRLSLSVVAVTWRYKGDGGWYPEIELHDWRNRSIRAFYEWYAPLVGKDVAAFI